MEAAIENVEGLEGFPPGLDTGLGSPASPGPVKERLQTTLNTEPTRITRKSGSPEARMGLAARSLPRSFDRSKHTRHIVVRFQTGVDPEESFRQLFERYHRRVYGFFSKRGISPDQCEDLVQETFLRVYQSLERFRHGSGFETWLFVIAANIYRDQLRESSAQKRLAAEIPLQSLLDPNDPLTKPGAEPSSEDPDAFERFLKKERLRMVRVVIDTLPARIRRCLILHYYHGLSYQDVAAALRLPLGSVKAHLHEGKRRVRERLQRTLTV